MRTAQGIEESKAQRLVENSQPNKRKGRGDAERIRPYQWKPGQSGNPGGRPKDDTAKEIAQAIFENNKEAAYEALAKALLKGNAYVFKELAVRAYGNVPEKVEISGMEGLAERVAKRRK